MGKAGRHVVADNGADEPNEHDPPMQNDPLTPEQLTARLIAVEQIVPMVQALARQVRGDPDLGAPPMLHRMEAMEQRLASQIADLAKKVDTVVNERNDEKAQVKGITRAMRIAGFTSVTSVVLFVIAVVAFVNRK